MRAAGRVHAAPKPGEGERKVSLTHTDGERPGLPDGMRAGAWIAGQELRGLPPLAARQPGIQPEADPPAAPGKRPYFPGFDDRRHVTGPRALDAHGGLRLMPGLVEDDAARFPERWEAAKRIAGRRLPEGPEDERVRVGAPVL